ncbi:MAG: hypothetical protein ABI672_17070, partial [Vicinamibacteria bacterium]
MTRALRLFLSLASRTPLHVVLVFPLAILGWLTWDGFRDYLWLKDQIPGLRRLDASSSDIARLDVEIADSARLSALTGDVAVETRYHEQVRRLAGRLAEARQLDPVGARIMAAPDVERDLVVLSAAQTDALELVRQGRSPEALQLLSTPDYEARRSRRTQAIEELKARVVRERAQVRDDLLAGMRRNAIGTGFGSALLMVGAVSSIVATRRWQAAVLGSHDKLKAKTRELIKLNSRLDRVVSDRTRELNASVLASLNMMEDAVRQQGNAEKAYENIELTHRQLVDASRQSGRAEVATNVLHNVGNVLNSVNVSAGLVIESMKNSRADSMTAVVAMIRDHEAALGEYLTSDPKGRHIPAFLEQLAQDW